ncbi:MAG TPA: glycosyltransferase family 2 protein, partial [Acidimicrobiales bacterium]|nr:glycosyltransferase family 2 protein [Acidimicrobiales bacterium]
MTSEPAVATIVVTYNSAGTIERCLRSLRGASVPSSIVVVDNASTDPTREVLSTGFPEVTVIPNGQNLGFAAACNLGMTGAAASEPTHYLFVNPDAYVEPTCLAELVDGMDQHPDAAVASPLILDAGSGAIWYAGAAGDVAKGIYWHVGVGEPDTGQYTET